jgi:hypothetical protein
MTTITRIGRNERALPDHISDVLDGLYVELRAGNEKRVSNHGGNVDFNARQSVASSNGAVPVLRLRKGSASGTILNQRTLNLPSGGAGTAFLTANRRK